MSEPKSLYDAKKLESFSEACQKAQDDYKKEVDSFWESLSYDDKLKAFSYVISKVYDADVVDRGSYRWCLYDKFGFQEDSYMIGMDCGYMTLHNIIYSGVDFDKFQTAKTVKMGYHTLDVDSKETLEFSFNEKTKELTIKTVDIFKEI